MKMYTSMDDLGHFLDERTGRLSLDLLPRPVFRRAEFLVAIVEAVTAGWNEFIGMPLPTVVPCRRRPGRQRCIGSIDAAYWEERIGHIEWQCQTCGDNGYISGYQNTSFDLTTTGSALPPDDDEVELDLTTPDYEAVRSIAGLDALATRVVKAARGPMTNGVIAILAPRACIEHLLVFVASAARTARGDKRLALEQVLRYPLVGMDEKVTVH